MEAFSTRLPWPNILNKLMLKKESMLAQGRDIIDFSESNPTKLGLDMTPVGREKLLSLFANKANLLYEPDPHGLRCARDAIVARCAERGLTAAADRIFLCASTSEAYSWLFKLLGDPGDTILIPRPGYPLFDYLANLESLRTRSYRLEYRHPQGWAIDLESVEEALARGRVKALVIINPNNPTGSYPDRNEREALLALCRRWGSAIVADEVFFDFRVEEDAPSSFVGEESVLCFALDGLSKLLGLPQMKLGWIAASGPKELLGEAVARLELIADTYLSAGSPVMNALPALLEGAQDFSSSLRKRAAANLGLLRSCLEGSDSPHRVLRCGGGWTAIIESPRLDCEEILGAGLLENEGLWSQPGYFFDMEREAFFTASLILEPGRFAEAARRYRHYFDRLMNGRTAVQR